VQNVNFARQVVISISALVLFIVALSAYAISRPSPKSNAVAAGDTTSLPQASNAPTPAVVTAPKAEDLPRLDGTPQSATAIKMVNIGGFLNEYWTATFNSDPAFKGHAFRPVKQIYVDTQSDACGQGSRTIPDYFCPGRYFISLTIAPADEAGATPVRNFIVAHEWGHAVQESANIHLEGEDMELQADCFAGAFLKYASDQRILSSNEVDLSTMHATVRAIGDDISPPVRGTEHGSGEQRAESLDKGWNMGPAVCLL
jgi:uncharacterized protein